MPLDMQEALDQYGFVGTLAKQHPELKGLLAQAVKGEWNSARFERALQDTKWYKALSERKRQVALLKTTDPATWKANLANKTTELTSLASRMGVKINAAYWAERALENDWDEASLRAIVMTNYDPRMTGSGEAKEIEAQLRETYTAYGMPVSADKVDDFKRQIMAGRNTIGGIQQAVITAAKKHYSQFAEEIDAGLSIRDIADPFVQTMANTLEISPTDIGLSDKYIKQALSARDSSGKPATMSLSEFERQLKNDARWGRTKQAKDETYSVLQQVGQDWGFL
jgi:hypothetical protein